MAEQYDRLSKRDIALATPVGGGSARTLDLVRVPQIDSLTYAPLFDGNYGQPMHDHIYRGRSASKVLQTAHIALHHVTFGHMHDSDRVANDLERKAQNFEEDDDFNIVGLDARLRDIIADYDKIREQKLEGRAKRIGKALASRTVMLVALRSSNVTGEAPDYFAAPVVGMSILRKGHDMTMEPVVESLTGSKGLMPENFYAVRGLYVPTR